MNALYSIQADQIVRFGI